MNAFPQNHTSTTNINLSSVGRYFNSPNSIKPVPVAETLCEKYTLIFSGGSHYQYREGYYHFLSPEEIKRLVLFEVGNSISRHKINEIVSFIEVLGYLSENSLNKHSYLNLKNGLLNLTDFTIENHTPTLYSTIQLNISFNKKAVCSLWEKALDQIFENDQNKIAVLQEFFGLCLTTEARYDKALILLGDGANGKSVILHVLEKLIGDENYSAIPLEKFNDMHYVANLFGKLANISIETSAKSQVYDSVFKAVVSGDVIEADLKFSNSFKFRPFCKLISSTNNLPRVDDKTDAFFRRLIILTFARQFSEKEQNKNLKFELENELPGILNWALKGLQRLRNRGYFELPESVKNSIDEYRQENNNLLIFVDENCTMSAEAEISKNALYELYSHWCYKYNYRAMKKIKFGKELQRHFKKIRDDKNRNGWYWTGITTRTEDQNGII